MSCCCVIHQWTDVKIIKRRETLVGREKITGMDHPHCSKMAKKPVKTQSMDQTSANVPLYSRY